MARQLYDYWFVQFDFPDENGRPYKSSGGAMVWDQKLKREIPQGWHCGTLLDIAEYTNGLACQKFRPTSDSKLPVIKIKEMHVGLSDDTEWVKADIPDEVKVFDGDVLFSWSASLEVMLWAYGKGGLNQHIFKVTSKNGYPRSFYFYQCVSYICVFKQMAEARKTTMGHITQDHLRQSTIALPPNIEIVHKLEEKLCPILDAIVKNSQEIMNLTKQRDELLPLLMNGQVSVKPTSVNCDLSHDYAQYSGQFLADVGKKLTRLQVGGGVFVPQRWGQGRRRVWRLDISMAATAASAPLLPRLPPARSCASSRRLTVRTPKMTGTPPRALMSAMPCVTPWHT